MGAGIWAHVIKMKPHRKREPSNLKRWLLIPAYVHLSAFLLRTAQAISVEILAKKTARKIRSKTVRAMMGLSFYTFRQRLEWVALKKGCRVVITTEEYTSKKHPQTGVVNRKLGSAKTVKLTDGSRACRDIVGAFNFFLKTLAVDTPTFN
jgi:transposase